MGSAAGDPGGDKRECSADPGMIDRDCGHTDSLTSIAVVQWARDLNLIISLE